MHLLWLAFILLFHHVQGINIQVLPFSGYGDPKLLTPNSTTVWEAGKRHLISWNSSYRLNNGRYYNKYTRVTIQLYDRKDNLLATALENFPFVLGYVYWTIPLNNSDGLKIGSNSSSQYYIMVYPSYFDWPNTCNGCKSNAPKSDLFTILPSTCDSKDPQCYDGEAGISPINPNFGIPTDGFQSDYSLAIKSVGLGVGIAAIVGFTIAFFVYTKKGKKTWQRYQRKRSGMNYKHNPSSPSIRPTIKNPPPLSRFFSSDSNQNPSETKEDEISTPPGTPLQIPQNAVLPAHAKMNILSLPPSPPNNPILKKSLFSSQDPVTKLTLPSNAYYTPNHSGLEYQKENINFVQSLPSINQSEAILVGNTFRNALRVSTHTEPLKHDSDSSNFRSKKLSITSTNASPVLSRLGWIEEEIF